MKCWINAKVHYSKERVDFPTQNLCGIFCSKIANSTSRNMGVGSSLFSIITSTSSIWNIDTATTTLKFSMWKFTFIKTRAKFGDSPFATQAPWLVMSGSRRQIFPGQRLSQRPREGDLRWAQSLPPRKVCVRDIFICYYEIFRCPLNQNNHETRVGWR